jgi:hypothetical protein
MQERVLATAVETPNSSAYEGGYDMRAVALSDASGKQLSIWLINRARKPVRAVLSIPSLRSRSVEMRSQYLSESDPNLNNYVAHQIRPRSEREPLAFDSRGRAEVNLPGSAVATLSFSVGLD